METLIFDPTLPFARITLNRPEQRNAMSLLMMDELIKAFEALEAAPEVRAVVMRGAGGSFCSGGDLADLRAAAGLPEDEQIARLARMDTLLDRVNHSSKVVIAVVEGAALGGGFGLICVSDIAIAVEGAVLGMPEVRIGLAPSLISPYVLQRIGLTTARRLMLTGVRFGAQEALGYGVVSEVCPPDGVEAALERLLGDLRQCSPHALAACKRLIFRSYESPPMVTAHSRASLLDALIKSEDAAEGMSAMLAKRPPKWAT
ncbi:MAG: enoyl-CoA hydratase/isomerase family protein [Anaerolineae bacterium]|nr:enoyl-CoA hydratase/isomerase family protein [Anaerolineae bacterium]